MRRFLDIALFAVMVLTAGAGCVRVARPPSEITYKEIPQYAWESLMHQGSFKFDYYTARSSMQFEVKGSGTVVLPDALRFKGTWRMGEEERALNLAAAGDYQLERQDNQWVPHPKSEEAKILEQADRVIRKALLRRKGRGFELVADEGKIITYSFQPNLFYLDPGFEKKYTAELVVDGRTLLAREINARSEDDDIQFKFSVSAINRRKRIRIPFSENFRLTYSPQAGRFGKAKSVLGKRLRDVGRKSRMRTRDGNLQVTLTFPVYKQMAQILAEPGQLVILGLNLDGPGPQINTRGEISDIFHIADTLALPVVRSVEVGFDSLSRPLLELVLAKAEPRSRDFDYLGVVVDGVLYEVLTVDNPTDILRIANVTTYEEALALSIKLRRPFNGELRFLDQERLR
ncbi:hypothetical protein ES703_06805 [subsurface metagenome]|nr:hypothetical protein [bacterium]